MKCMRSALFALSFVLIFGVVSMCAQSFTKAEQEVRKLERAWLDAYESHDGAAMTVIVADDFLITFPDGRTQTKPQILQSLKRPGADSKFVTENVKSRVYGDTVILTGIVVTEWKQDGKSLTDRSSYTDTYVKRSGKWQVVASHLSNAGK